MGRHVLPHPLDDAGARALIGQAFSHYAERYPAAKLQLVWTSDTRAELEGLARGLKMKARVELQPGRCLLDVDVPFVLRPFQDLAQRAIEREVKRWLERAASS
jgi:hypothetical protein